MPARILVVDDEAIVRRFLTLCLSGDHQVEAAADGQEALERLEAESFDLVISDIQMPRKSGLELAKWLQEHRPRVHCILISGYADTYADDIELLGCPFLAKPIAPARIKHVVAALLSAKP